MSTATSSLLAGGGLVLEDDRCIVEIEFYSAHFTAYQPDTRGSEQFCDRLPDLGHTIFVLDYLHESLKEVPVGFRVIRDVTGQGRYVKLKHVEELGDLTPHTVFEQSPVIRPDASFRVEHAFAEGGRFVGIVSAGHPSSDRIYTAVFPFEVGGSDFPVLLPALAAAVGVFGLLAWRRRRQVPAAQPGDDG